MNMEHSGDFSFAAEKTQGFIQRVYQWMAAGLALTGFIAYFTSTNVNLLQAIHGGGFWVLIIVQLGLVFWLSSQALKISPTAAIAGFCIYSALNGLTMSYIFIIYTSASIASTFLICAGTFAGVSVFGWVTKTDLTSIRGFLWMGLIGIIIASLVNIFFKSPAIYWAVTYIGVAVFIGLTAYDTQKLKNIHQSGAGTSEQMAILGALMLYLDFINLFIMLLRIFGRRR